MLVSIAKASQILGVTIKTLHRWDKNGTMKAYRTVGNHRRYDLDALYEFLENGYYTPTLKHSTNKAAIYARVSSHKQREDMNRQIEFLTQYAKKAGYETLVYSDIGSGLNDSRTNLLRLIRHSFEHRFDCVYITYLDRLARFGTRTILEFLQRLGISVKAVQVPEKIPYEKLLVNDMIALVTSFAGKMHRMRRGKNTKKAAIST